MIQKVVSNDLLIIVVNSGLKHDQRQADVTGDVKESRLGCYGSTDSPKHALNTGDGAQVERGGSLAPGFRGQGSALGIKRKNLGVPVVVQWLTNAASIHGDTGSIPGRAQWVKDPTLL